MFDTVGGVEPLLDPQLHPHRGILNFKIIWLSSPPPPVELSYRKQAESRRIIIILVTSALAIAYLAILT